MRKKIIISLGCFVSSILLVVAFYFISDKLNHRPNGFVRLFPPHKIYPLHIFDLRYNSYYISGASSDKIYFGNYTTFNYILCVNYSLTDSNSLYLTFPAGTKLVQGSSRISVDSQEIYIHDGRIPVVYRAALSDLQAKKLPHDTAVYFIDAKPVSRSSSVLRVFDRGLHESIMAKENFEIGSVTYAPNLLEKQTEGLFSTDGILNALYDNNRLLYTYFYRNQFICMDTSLRVIYRGRTIDTISEAQVHVAKVKSTGVTTLASPPLTVNKHCCINEKWILIHSLLKANNEDQKEFDKCSVIDAYSLADGKYNFSFYLPDYKGNKITDFRMANNTLIVLYGNYAYSWLINFSDRGSR